MLTANITLSPTGGFRREKFTTSIAFLLLFPGFFFYQTLIGMGVIGAVLGGYFTLVALVLALPLFFSYMSARKKNRNWVSSFDLCLVLFIIYYSLVLAVNAMAGANPLIVERYVQSMIFCIETYIMFLMLDLKDNTFVRLALFSFLAMSVITFYLSVDGFFYLQSLGEAKDPDSVATYQGFARSYIYTHLILISVANSRPRRFLMYAFAVPALFLNGARSEFSAVLFLVPLIEVYYAKRRLLAILVFVSAVAVFWGSVEPIASMLPDNRTLQLLDLSNSTSVAAREQLSSNALRTIAQSPIFGDFASYPDGHYAHNILCAWVDFGIFGFLFFSGILLWPAFWLFVKGFFLKTRSSDFVLAWSFICITILWVLMAKNIPDMSVGAAMGAFAKYRYGNRHAERQLMASY